jgi:hypothetical protein
MNEKWGRILFLVGAIGLILLGLAHSLSFFEDPAPANATEQQLNDLMTHYRFNLAGSMRTVSELLRGFSISFMLGAIGLGVVDVLLWRERAGLLRRMALINAIWLALLTAVSIRYFFIVPTLLLAAPLAIFLVAWLSLPAETRS